MHTVDYAVVLIYLALMVLIGIKTRNSSLDISDYIRMGNKSTWWMAGFSIFMGTFSAATFTGIAGSAFLAGWSVLITPLCGALGFFLQAAIFAPLLRRTRAVTPLDAVKLRFGAAAEQVKVYVSTLTSFFFAGFFLLGFATFASAIFGIPMWIIIIVMGLIVVYYSVSGGTWSVQITDSLQALILIPVTVAFAILCLVRVGGIDGLFEGIQTAGLGKDYALFKPPDYEYTSPLPVRKGNFTLLWAVASVFNGIIAAISINSAHRYLSLRDESSARKAAFLAGMLMVCGCVIWFIPPIVGRLVFEADIEAIRGIPNPADSAYAVTAMKLLPPGLLGLIFICMMAATMSSMDGFLTGTSGYIVRNLFLPLRKTLGKQDIEPRRVLRITRFTNLALGLWAIFMAFVLNEIAGQSGMFEVMQTIVTVIGAPAALPFALSLVYRRIPLWGLFAGIGCGLATSVTLFTLRGRGLMIEWGYEVFMMTAACVLPTLISSIWWNRSSPRFRDHVNTFFDTIHRPINADEEVGAHVDSQLLKSVGTMVLGVATLILVLLFWCANQAEVLTVLGISGFLFLVGGFMLWKSREAPTREELEAVSRKPD